MSDTDWKLTHIRESAVVFALWKQSGLPGLSKATFSAWIVTLHGLADLAVHLIQNHGFSYVLLGKLQSDALEARFGIYRQLNGASFFMSIRQVLHAEKKIRVLNLMQMGVVAAAVLSSNVSPSVESIAEVDVTDVAWLRDQINIPHDLDFCLTEVDENLVYYTSGSIGRSIGRVRKCTSCKDLLVECDAEDQSSLNAAINTLYGNADATAKQLLNLVDRGGLAKPTCFHFALCSFVFFCFKQISEKDALLDELLLKPKQCNIFVNAVSAIASVSFPIILHTKCKEGHSVFNIVAKKLFNLFSRNVLKRINQCT